MTDPKTTSDTLRRLVLMLRAERVTLADCKADIKRTLEDIPVYADYLGRVETYRREKKMAEKYIDIALSVKDADKLHEAVKDEHDITQAHLADREEIKEWLAALPAWVEYKKTRKRLDLRLGVLNNSVALCVELGPDQIEMPFVSDPEIPNHLDDLELDLDNG